MAKKQVVNRPLKKSDIEIFIYLDIWPIKKTYLLKNYNLNIFISLPLIVKLFA